MPAGPNTHTMQKMLQNWQDRLVAVERRLARSPASPPPPDWDDITDKPSTFPPSAHTQDWTTITGKPSVYPPDLPPRLGSVAQSITNWNDAKTNGWYMGSSVANAPTTAWHIGTVVAHNTTWCTQTVYDFTSDGAADTKMWRRELNNNVWGGWYRLRIAEAELDARYARPGVGSTPFAMASGRVTSVAGGGSSPPIYWDNLATVTLPAGRFSQPPNITVTSDTGNQSSVGAGHNIMNVTAASFQVRQNRVGAAPGTSFVAHWIAVQMTAGASNG